MSHKPLSKLRNLGPKSAAWLCAAGIDDLAALREVGVEEAFRRVLSAGHAPSINLAYALYGALHDIDWRGLADDERSRLVLMVDALRDSHRQQDRNSLARCAWCGSDPVYVAYHDGEWGVPVHDDRTLFEFLVLEGAQAGLSWITILRKRSGYRRAFADFDPATVAGFDEKRIAALMSNSEIVRNRAKIAATVGNARAFLEIQARYGSFDRFVWAFVDGMPRINRWATQAEVPATSPESDALAKALKQHGFKFVGSTICYAHMQATGMINDHLVSCFRHAELAGAAR